MTARRGSTRRLARAIIENLKGWKETPGEIEFEVIVQMSLRECALSLEGTTRHGEATR